jgi:hypothetical protein
MDYLLEDAPDRGEDFVPQRRRELVPDFLGRRGHGSFSWSQASNSRTAWAVSLERTVGLGKPAKLVHWWGKRRLTAPR